MKRDIRHKYLHILKRDLGYISGTEKKSLEVLSREIELYIDEHTTYEDLVEHFGELKNLANSFIEEYDESTIKNKIKYKRVLLVTSLIISIAIILIVALYLLNYIDARNSYITREQEIITEE